MINKDADRLIKKLIDVQTRYPLPKFRSIYKERVGRQSLFKIGDYLCPVNR
jgi:hypothetical protein